MVNLNQKIKPNIAPVRAGQADVDANEGAAAGESLPQAEAGSNRVPSGIPGLDGLISGGFERGGTTLVMGDSGSGKTTFLAQFVYNGAVQYSEPGVILSFEEPNASIIKHMGNFGFDFAALEDRGLFASVNYRPHEVKKLVDEGGGLIWDTISSIGAKRLVIDSLTSYAMLFDSVYRAREAELGLFELLRKWKCTTLLSADGLHTDTMKITTGMEFLSDGIIQLHHPRHQSSRFRAIEVYKMRGTRHSEKLCPFKFIEGEGLRVYPNETIFYDVENGKQE